MGLREEGLLVWGLGLSRGLGVHIPFTAPGIEFGAPGHLVLEEMLCCLFIKWGAWYFKARIIPGSP